MSPFSFSTVPCLVYQSGAAARPDAPARDLVQHNMAVRVYSEVIADEAVSIIVTHVDGSEEARAGALIVAPQQIARIAGIETTLQQVGTSEGAFDRLADHPMKQTRLLGNNPRALTRHDARAICAGA
ncbi:MAG TPA: iron-containing alcohol dehydrogenase [Telluria sp.]|nr:iron-containing alcohol dehydrogenase [Telluria sp.]